MSSASARSLARTILLEPPEPRPARAKPRNLDIRYDQNRDGGMNEPFSVPAVSLEFQRIRFLAERRRGSWLLRCAFGQGQATGLERWLLTGDRDAAFHALDSEEKLWAGLEALLRLPGPNSVAPERRFATYYWTLVSALRAEVSGLPTRGEHTWLHHRIRTFCERKHVPPAGPIVEIGPARQAALVLQELISSLSRFSELLVSRVLHVVAIARVAWRMTLRLLKNQPELPAARLLTPGPEGPQLLRWAVAAAAAHGVEARSHSFSSLESCLVTQGIQRVIHYRSSAPPMRAAWLICHELSHLELDHRAHSACAYDVHGLRPTERDLYAIQEHEADVLADLLLGCLGSVRRLGRELLEAMEPSVADAERLS